MLGYLRFCKLCKSHSKASLSTLTLFAMPSDTERASVPASIAESFHERDPVRATASGSSGQTLSNSETLELFSQLLDAKFDQTFAAFKRDLDEKEAATQS